MTDEYINTVRLLLSAAPAIFKQPHFAIKGGTALNLFVQNMPRLSVDIDVVFTQYQMPRTDALGAIGNNLRAAAAELVALDYSVHLPKTTDGNELKMVVRDAQAQVKVEVNCVFRGALYPVAPTPLAPAAQQMFTTDMTLPVLQTAELYGSKLVAAMDRQHPRDLYDVRLMLDQFGLDADIVSSFVAYLCGHNRPVHEVLFSNMLAVEKLRIAYENDFEGMTLQPVPFERLVATQAEIHATLPAALTDAQRRFLLSLVRLEPEWNLMPYPHLQNLPAVNWKLLNLAKLKKARPQQFAEQHQILRDRFDAL